MFRVLIIACLVSELVNSIIVNDPPLHTEYRYSYNIEDPTTGDMKSQHESKHGDVVKGEYTVNDPDGTKRIVEYTADATNGFTAVVRKEPLGHVASASPTVSGYYNNHKNIVEALKQAQNVRRTGPVTYEDETEMRYFIPSNEIKSDNFNEYYYGQYFVPS